jgi:two-component system phosphate regulon sensor histidine kinase PhoR
MADGLLVVDDQGCIVVYNRPAEDLLALPVGTLAVGRRLLDLARLPKLQELLEQATFDESLLEVAPRRFVRVHVTRVPSAGTPPMILVAVRNAQDAERLQSMRREFVANVAHEVRTPLAAIRGYSATLLAGALSDDERARHFVEVIEQHAERLGQLVDDLGTLADLEQGDVELQRAAVDVGGVVDAAVNVCRAQALRCGVSLQSSVAYSTPQVNADRDLLEQALVRLIANAIRYTPSGGNVSVAANCAPEQAGPGTWVRFSVVDTGVGVPTPDLERLGERFYRVDKGRSRARGGCGLGLAVVKHIVYAHGGTMAIASELQRGTAVTLYWPGIPQAQSCADGGDHSADRVDGRASG